MTSNYKLQKRHYIEIMADKSPTAHQQPLNLEIKNLASQCVKCGLCLPHCPTYELTQDENESPRGRIELLHALADEKLPPSKPLLTHLDHCLSCRACERVCPAKVEYGNLITKGRKHLQAKRKDASSFSLSNLLMGWITQPGKRRAIHWMTWILEISRLRTIGNFLKIPDLIGLKTFNAVLPRVQKPIRFKSFYPATTAKQGQVGLFLGCIQQITDQNLIQASIDVLTYFGYDVHIPEHQSCCGAIDFHSGQNQKGTNCANQNLEAFDKKLDYIVTLATGCGTTLYEYPKYLHQAYSPKIDLHSFAKKIVDISSLLLNSTWPLNLNFNSEKKNIIVHSSCTLKNIWRKESDPIQLLKRIPNLNIIPLNHPHCCGAAGRYMFDFPEVSNALGQRTLQAIQEKNPSVLATSNVGCALHLKNQLQSHNLNILVLHPIIILRNAIKF